MIVRYEPWGAWVKLESTAAIVALDRDGVRKLGLDGGDAWSARSAASAASASPPLEVHLAVTSRCGAGCKGCYLDARPDGIEPPREALLAALDAMRDAGVFTVAFGGGEPTTRADIDVLAQEARRRGITPVLTTSGAGLGELKLDRLRAFAQVNVSYDGASAAYDSVRGYDGASVAEDAIALLARAGVRVGVNVVLTRRTFAELGATLARARDLGANEAQLLRYKPAGRAASLEYLAQRLDGAQVAAFGATLRALSAALSPAGEFPIRIDCALVPFLSSDEALARDPAALARFGVFGCEAGGALASVNVHGRVAPCSFAAATSLDARDLANGFARDATLERWRAWTRAPDEPCASCSLRSVCKGGCKVVASHVDGAHGPDPECPRVRAHREGRAAVATSDATAGDRA
jgi:radical SAM protein with 4Fe4S-binding SPASM domain